MLYAFALTGEDLWAHPVAPIIATAFVTLFAWYLGQGALAWWTARRAAQLGISGDAKAARRDSLADRDEWIETLTKERDDARERAVEAESREQAALGRDHALADYAIALRAQIIASGGIPSPWPDAAKR